MTTEPTETKVETSTVDGDVAWLIAMAAALGRRRHVLGWIVGMTTIESIEGALRRHEARPFYTVTTIVNALREDALPSISWVEVEEICVALANDRVLEAKPVSLDTGDPAFRLNAQWLIGTLRDVHAHDLVRPLAADLAARMRP